MNDLADALDATRRRVDARLDTLLQGGPERLCAAMRYVVLGGGKRLRPILVLWTQEMLGGGKQEPVLDLACAFELVHSYSLVHDDLPCMDDDTLRRGRPTCHVQFDQATAVLAGDALLNLAYETVVTAPWSDPARGLAFQIVDDVLDVVGASQALGKTAGKDAATGKITYPALYGVEASRGHALRHIEAARGALRELPESERLQALATWIGARMH